MRLTANLVPDVAELMTTYSLASWLFDPLVPVIVSQLHAWLMEMERDQADLSVGGGLLFGGRLDYDKEQSLHGYLRSGFAALSE
jgi:hypothetical protein